MGNVYVIVDGELYHHGIKGMKWGRRRFQNKDGSLTPAGVKRYGDGGSTLDRWKANREAKRAEKAKSKAETDAAKKAKSEETAYRKKQAEGMSDDGINKAIARSQLEERYNQQVRNKDANEGSYRNKSVKDMTDEELARAIERSRMEQTYNQLNPKHVPAGKQFISTAMNDYVKPIVVDSGKNFMNKLGDAVLKKYFPEAEKLDLDSEIKKVKLDTDKIKLESDKLKLEIDKADKAKKDAEAKKAKDDAEADREAKEAKAKAEREANEAKAKAEREANDPKMKRLNDMNDVVDNYLSERASKDAAEAAAKQNSKHEKAQSWFDVIDEYGNDPVPKTASSGNSAIVRSATDRGLSAREISESYGIPINEVLKIRNPNARR
jgi:membrane protein involved in colicin uptake